MTKQEEFKLAIINNDISKVNSLLENTTSSLSRFNFYSYGFAAENGYTEITKILLKKSKIDPSCRNNIAIKLASENKHTTIVNLLFNTKIVRDTLKNNDLDLYNSLIKKHVSNNIETF